jgi:UDP-N-acetylglucosamine--dolichyl-phosphate N-acetylglucosaminephosphotransferase
MDSAVFALPTVAFVASYAAARAASRMRDPRVLAPDVYKAQGTYIPKVGGVAVIISALASLIIALGVNMAPLWFLFLTVVFVGSLGLLDDLYGLPALLRVVIPVVPSLLIILWGIVNYVHIPLIGNVRNPYVVEMVVLLSIPVLSNAVNMLDVVNGVVPGSMALISITMAIDAYIMGRQDAILPAITIASTSLGLYLLNRYPARVFNGNSGSYALGAALGAYAVIYNMGFPVLVASIPYVLNGLYIVVSSRGIKSRERLIRPTLLEGGVVRPNPNPRSPLTLVRLLVIEKPLGEREISRGLLLLFLTSCILSIASSIMFR